MRNFKAIYILVISVGILLYHLNGFAKDTSQAEFDVNAALHRVAENLEFIYENGSHDHYLGRIYVLLKKVRIAIHVIETESPYSNKPFVALVNMLRHFKYSTYLLASKDFPTAGTRPYIDSIIIDHDNIAAVIGDTNPTEIHNSLEVLVKNYQLIKVQPEITSAFKSLLGQHIAKLADVIAIAAATGDRRTAFNAALPVYKATVKDIYPRLHAEIPMSFELLDIIGTNEFLGEYIEANIE